MSGGGNKNHKSPISVCVCVVLLYHLPFKFMRFIALVLLIIFYAGCPKNELPGVVFNTNYGEIVLEIDTVHDN